MSKDQDIDEASTQAARHASSQSLLLPTLSPDLRRKRLLLFSLLTSSVLILVGTLYWLVERELQRGLEENLDALAQSNARAASLVAIKVHDVLRETANTPAINKAFVDYLLAAEKFPPNSAELKRARDAAASGLAPGHWTLTNSSGQWLPLSDLDVSRCAPPLQRPFNDQPQNSPRSPQLINADCLTNLYQSPDSTYAPIRTGKANLELQLFR